MTDKVFIKNLQAECVIGVYDWERTIRQRLCINIEMAADISAAAANDNIKDALDYHAISVRLTEYIEQSSFKLIETLAESLAGILQKEFAVGKLKLSVTKPGAIANADAVGVEIKRTYV